MYDLISGFLPVYDINELFNFDYGSGINIHEVNQARRKIHRGKMYRSYRGSKNHPCYK